MYATVGLPAASPAAPGAGQLPLLPHPSSFDKFISELGAPAAAHVDQLSHILTCLGRALSALQVAVLRPSASPSRPGEGDVLCMVGLPLQLTGIDTFHARLATELAGGSPCVWDLFSPPPGLDVLALRHLNAATGARTLVAVSLPPSAPAPGGMITALLGPGDHDEVLCISLLRIAALHLVGALVLIENSLAQVDAERRYRSIAAAGQASDSLFHEVLKHTDDAVFFLRVESGPRFVYELVNVRFSEFTGLADDAVIDHTAQQLFNNNAATRFERDYRECHATGTAITREQHVVLTTGVFVFRTTLIPVKNADGSVIRLIGFATDVTDLRQQQTLLAESEAVARTGGWDIDCITQSLRWTPGTHLIFETSPESYRPTIDSALSFYTEDCREAVAFAVKSALQTGAHFDFTATARTTTGRIINLRALGQTEQVDGRIVRIVGAIVDITAHEEAEQERLRLEAQLRRAQKMEAIGTLAGGIAHDFNNILAGIMGNVQLAASDLPEDGMQHRFLDRAFQSCLRARDLVRRMLTFSRQVEQTHTATAFRPLLEEAVALLRASLPANIDIQTRYPSEPLNILADSGQIHQVILNLATNAAHAMSPNGGTLTIELVSSPPDDVWHRRHPQVDLTHCIRLCVRDTGCGMGQETVERIFEPFFTTKPFGEGSGLGLAMVHGIVENHGGAIVVESTVGRGSAFHLFFPAPVRTVAASSTTPPLARSAVAVGRGQNILVVDDEASITALVGPVLHHLGYRACVCQSPDEALAIFNESPGAFDALLTDFSMPGMNGLDLAAAIREIRPDLPVVIMTGFLRAHDLTPLRDSGLHHLINKPFTMEVLASKFSEIFRTAPILG